MRPLFEALRKEVLALDPCVTEELLKIYVAYHWGRLRQPGLVSASASSRSHSSLSESVAASSASEITCRSTDRAAPSCSTVAARRLKYGRGLTTVIAQSDRLQPEPVRLGSA
jgi:hypothetical protein